MHCCAQVGEALMPDGLHPNEEGMKLLARCMDPLINELLHQEHAG